MKFGIVLKMILLYIYTHDAYLHDESVCAYVCKLQQQLKFRHIWNSCVNP